MLSEAAGQVLSYWQAAADPKATFPKSTYYFPKADIDHHIDHGGFNAFMSDSVWIVRMSVPASNR